jgi:DNA invertase Pin-like site-specific DNA recombinase
MSSFFADVKTVKKLLEDPFNGLKADLKGDPNIVIFGYTRVSTIMQSEDGISLDDQRARILKEATDVNATCYIFTDAGISGKNFDRRGYQKMWSYLEKIKHIRITVISTSLSRLGRSASNLIDMNEKLKKLNHVLKLLDMEIDTGNVYGSLIFNVLASLAQIERELISSRVKDAMAHKRKLGEAISRPRYGWRVDPHTKKFVEVPEQQQVISGIRKMYEANPNVRICDIQKELKAAGIRSQTGKDFSSPSIKNIMINNKIGFKEEAEKSLDEQELELKREIEKEYLDV